MGKADKRGIFTEFIRREPLRRAAKDHTHSAAFFSLTG
jgi:hypothetical protein